MRNPPAYGLLFGPDRQVSCHWWKRVGTRQKATETGILDRHSQESPTEKCRKNENWHKLKQFCKSFEKANRPRNMAVGWAALIHNAAKSLASFQRSLSA
jgi:hypothetical protein